MTASLNLMITASKATRAVLSGSAPEIRATIDDLSHAIALDTDQFPDGTSIVAWTAFKAAAEVLTVAQYPALRKLAAEALCLAGKVVAKQWDAPSSAMAAPSPPEAESTDFYWMKMD